jgi:aspartyl-tRNA(Asn)/glutamyl-tRNA(Gln) amidotransferase subunit C
MQSMLSEEEFTQLARLARLDPADPGLQGIRQDFNRILDYVDHIGEVDTRDVDASYTRSETRNAARADVPGAALPLHAIGKIAPQWEAGHFVVPGAIDAE